MPRIIDVTLSLREGMRGVAFERERDFFVAAPLKIEDGDGCSCRAFAIESLAPESLPL